MVQFEECCVFNVMGALNPLDLNELNPSDGLSELKMVTVDGDDGWCRMMADDGG